MRIWQEPGERRVAEWICLSSELDWKEHGGIWAKKAHDPHAYHVLTVERNPEEDDESERFLGYVRCIDLTDLTLPELMNILADRWNPKRLLGTRGLHVLNVAEWMLGPSWSHGLLERMSREGRGVSLTADDGLTVVGVRQRLKKQLSELPSSTEPSLGERLGSPVRLSVVEKRGERLRKENFYEYVSGFAHGMQRCSVEGVGEPNPAFLAGWEHGWEYAVGRVGLPEWFRFGTRADETGR